MSSWGRYDFADSGGNISIVVASDKEVKVGAVRRAFQDVFGRATVSGMVRQHIVWLIVCGVYARCSLQGVVCEVFMRCSLQGVVCEVYVRCSLQGVVCEVYVRCSLQGFVCEAYNTAGDPSL